MCDICGCPFTCRDERHRSLRERGNRQRWIHSRVGGYRRTVDYVEAFVAEDAVMVVDYAVLGACAHAGAAEDVGGGGGAEEGFGEEAAGEAVDLLFDAARQL